jgi:hypothetical protein
MELISSGDGISYKACGWMEIKLGLMDYESAGKNEFLQSVWTELIESAGRVSSQFPIRGPN